MHVLICTCIKFVRVYWERQTDREGGGGGRQTDRQTDRDTDKETKTETERETVV